MYITLVPYIIDQIILDASISCSSAGVFFFSALRPEVEMKINRRVLFTFPSG